MRYGLGVDLGTTFVAAAISQPDRTEMVLLGDSSVVAPAVVYLRNDGMLITGDAASRWGMSSPERLGRALERRLGDPTPVVLGGVPHAVPDLLGTMLRDVVRKVSAAQAGPPDNIVLTRPANWGPLRRGLFEQVMAIAGLRGAVTVAAPEAAAAHYAATRHPADGEIVAVYDLGGGTFDAAVLRTRPHGVEVMGTPEGVERLGGIDFDDAILSYVNYRSGGALSELDLQDPRTMVALARLRQDCVLAKEALSADSEAHLPVFLPGRPLDVRLTRADLEDMLRAPVESTIGALSRTLRSARVSPRELGAVLMVGGSTRIPLVDRMVSEGLAGAPLLHLHPDHAVALGAATLAARLPIRAHPAPAQTPLPPPAGPPTWPPQRRPGPSVPAGPQTRPPVPPPVPHPTRAGPTSRPPPAARPPAPAALQGTSQPGEPVPADDRSSTEGDWQAPSIGRMLVFGVVLLALAVAIGLIAYVVISRLQVT